MSDNKDWLLSEIEAKPARLHSQSPAIPVREGGPTIADLAENAVLAGCVRNAEYAADALARLTAGDFDMEWRQTVWQAMLRLSERGERITSAALYPLLGPRLWDRLAQATECSWQNQWGDPLPPNPHLHDFVAEVAGWAERRRATAAMLASVSWGVGR